MDSDYQGRHRKELKERQDACEFCGRELDPGGHVAVAVPDSMYLHPKDLALDGRRPARACSPEHADEQGVDVPALST